MVLIISIMSGFLTFCLITIFFSPFAVQQEIIQTRIRSIANMNEREYIDDEDLKKPITERIFKPFLHKLSLHAKKLIPTAKGTEIENPKTAVFKKKLRQAGIRISTVEYRMIQLLVTIGIISLLGMLSLFFTQNLKLAVYAVVFGIYMSYVFLRFHLAVRIRKRQDDIGRQLPEVLDMLSVSVEAGLGLEQAILHVIEKFKGPLVDELHVSYREMTMGKNRREALIGLGDRCEVDDVKSFVRAINQASHLGISIKNVLRSQSAFIRQSRRNRIEERAQKVSVKILLPMAVFIFPVIFIVLLGPAAIRIYDQLL